MHSGGSALQILVVEDNDSLREATVDFLNASGHSAAGVVSAEDVDDTPQAGQPDRSACQPHHNRCLVHGRHGWAAQLELLRAFGKAHQRQPAGQLQGDLTAV